MDDVCVVCALPEEAQAFLNQVTQYCKNSWTRMVNQPYGYTYDHTVISNGNDEQLSIHLSALPRYGPTEMALHLRRVLEQSQPRFVIMTGICAGDRRKVKLGDLVVAERTFIYDTGKFVKDELGRVVHNPDTITYQMHENTLQFARLFNDGNARIGHLTLNNT